MSAYMVDNDTIGKIVGFLYSKTYKNDSRYTWLLDDIGVKLTSRNKRKQFAKRLIAMNSRALYARYGDNGNYNIHTDFIPLMYPAVSSVQVYKTIRCYLYQCSEGNVPDEPLYKLMGEISDRLAHEIINSLPEYDKAKWG